MYYSIKPSEHITKISNLHSSKIRRNLEFTFNSKYSLFIGSEFWDIISMFSGLFSLEEITNLIKSRHNFSQETIHSILAKLERQQVIKENDELSMWGEPIKFGSNTKLLKQYSVYFFDQDTISVDLGILLSKYDFAYLLYPQDMIITTQMVAESVFLDETNVGQRISAMFIEKFHYENVCFSSRIEDSSQRIIISNDSYYSMYYAENSIVIVPSNYENKSICQFSIFSLKTPSADVSLFCKALNIHNDVLLSVLNGVYS